MTVLPPWSLSLPLPAVLLIALCVYVLLLVGALWCRQLLLARCSPQCGNGGGSCCADIAPPCDSCLACARSCDWRPPSLRSCLDRTCPSAPCAVWDCACTCQAPDCDSVNCLCFEIKFR